MQNRSRVVFLVVLLGLAGGGLMMAIGLTTQYFFTDQLPATPLFRDIFPVWMFLALAAAICGFVGGYSALRSGRLRNGYITTFGILYSLALKVEHVELAWSAVGLKFFLGYDRLSVGVNVLGVVLLVWLGRLRHQEAVTAQAKNTVPAEPPSADRAV